MSWVQNCIMLRVMVLLVLATVVIGAEPSAVDVPYSLDTIPDLQALLLQHQQYQTAALSDSTSPTAPVILVKTNSLVGLGNRVPAIVTGFVLALFTKRLYMMHSDVTTYVDLPFPSAWLEYMNRYRNTSQCDMRYQHFVQDSMEFCDETQGTRLTTAHVMGFSSIDYDLPFLQVNPALEKYFKKFFPDGEVFQPIIQYLFRPKQVLLDAMEPYKGKAERCVAGMHMRTRKYAGVRVKQFVSIARMVSQGQEGTVFVASDAQLFPYVQRGLPDRLVWWSNMTSTSLQAASRTRGNNPASELSAIMDVFLLSKCKHIVLTPASSMGAVAAGLAGVKPVYANFGRHADPFLNPWFWKSTTTEPCCFKASNMHITNDTLSTLIRNKHPLYLYHNQCHYQDRYRQAPTYLKLQTSDLSYLQMLINH